jgi:cobalt-zinc-cadmium efflux system outer membrane protein
MHLAVRHRTRAVGALVLTVFASAPSARAQQVPLSQGPTVVITLDQAARLALTRNQSLRAQRLNVDQAKANEITAALKPNPVFTSANADFPVFTPSQLSWTNLANTQTFTQSLTYLFERGDKRARRLQVAQDTTEVTARGVEDAERQLRWQVGQAFIGTLLAKSSLDFASQALKDFSEVVAVNRQRLADGDISEGDYLKISLQELQVEQDVSAAEVALVQGKAMLRQLVGYDAVPEDFDVAGTLAYKKYATALEDLRREARAARPDLRAAAASTRLASNTVTLAYANRALDLTGEVEYDRNGPVNAVGAGFSIALPIHDRNQGEIARSKVAVTQAQEAESAVLSGVLTDVTAAYAAYRASDKVVTIFESGYLDQARRSREISTYAYRRGASSLLDLLDAERTYRATELAYRQALAAYATSVEQINFVVGRQVLQ